MDSESRAGDDRTDNYREQRNRNGGHTGTSIDAARCCVKHDDDGPGYIRDRRSANRLVVVVDATPRMARSRGDCACADRMVSYRRVEYNRHRTFRTFTESSTSMKDFSKLFAQPTGPTVVGDGAKKNTVPLPEQTEIAPIPQTGSIVGQRGNDWTDLGQPESSSSRGRKIGPWMRQAASDIAPPMTHEQMQAIAAASLNLQTYDNLISRMRERLFDKPWAAIIGGGIGQGVAAGTTGVATVHAGRCLLEGVHNPTSVAITFGVSDVGSGDPIPKFSTTVGPGMTVVIGCTGVLFERGVTLIAMTGGTALTFFGRSLD